MQHGFGNLKPSFVLDHSNLLHKILFFPDLGQVIDQKLKHPVLGKAQKQPRPQLVEEQRQTYLLRK